MWGTYSLTFIISCPKSHASRRALLVTVYRCIIFASTHLYIRKEREAVCEYGLRKLRNICCGRKMFLNKIRNIFSRPGHEICVCNKCCARGQTGKHLSRQQCVGNNVSSFARAWQTRTSCCGHIRDFKMLVRRGCSTATNSEKSVKMRSK